MSRSGVALSSDCVTTFNELKIGKKLKYIIYRISDDEKEIVVDEKSSENDWESFREKLINAKTAARNLAGKEVKDENGNAKLVPSPRFAVYDIEFTKEGAGVRNKILFISWNPDDAPAGRAKMAYAASKKDFQNALTGISTAIQANSENDLEYDEIVKDLAKNTA